MNKWVKVLGGVVVVVIAIVVGGVAVLMSLDFNEYKGLIAEKAKEATGRELKIAGNLDLKISLTPSIEVKGVSFANAAWGSRPEMITIKRFAAEVALLPLLSGQVTINQVILEGVDLIAEKNAKGVANWEFETMAADKSKADASSGGGADLPAVHKVSIRDIKISYVDAVSGQKFALGLDRFDASASGANDPLKIDIKGGINGQAFSAGGTVGSVGQMAGGETFPLKLKAAALGIDATIGGNLGLEDGLRAALDLSVKGASLPNTVAAAASIVPALKDMQLPPITAFSLTTKAKVDPATVTLEGLTLSLDKNVLTGRIAAKHGGARPSVDVALMTDSLDLDALLPKSDGAAAPAQPAKDDGRVFPADPLPLDGLKAADAKFAFDAKTLIAKGLTIGDVKVRLALAGGKLTVSEIGAKAFDGVIAGNALVDASKGTPAIAAKIKVSQIDYGKLLEQQGMKDTASGKADADIDVSGAGGSVRAIMAGLGGKLRLQTKDGKLESNAVNIVSADIFNMFDSKDDKTIKCGVVHFNITKGQAAAHAIVFETGGISVIGTGGANLADETLKLHVDPRAKKTNLASAAMVPVDILGTFKKPDWAIDAGAMAGNVAAGAARTAGAIATGGLSLLLEKAVKSAGPKTDETDYCTPALAGKAVVPGKMTEAKASGSDGAAPSGGTAQPEKKEGVGGAVEGVSKGLKSLFGN